MKFDNSRTIINLRIRLFAATVLFLAYIILTYAAEMIKYPLLGLSDTIWTLILIAVYFFIAFMPTFLNYQFISYSDDGDKIIFRYFPSGLVGGKKNSVEIVKKTFSGYKINSSFFGFKQSITLFTKFKEGVAKYPPIYISALTREERTRVIRSLNLFITHP